MPVSFKPLIEEPDKGEPAAKRSAPRHWCARVVHRCARVGRRCASVVRRLAGAFVEALLAFANIVANIVVCWISAPYLAFLQGVFVALLVVDRYYVFPRSTVQDLQAHRAQLVAELKEVDQKLARLGEERHGYEEPWDMVPQLRVFDVVADNPTISAVVAVVLIVLVFSLTSICWAQTPHRGGQGDSLGIQSQTLSSRHAGQIRRAPSSSRLNRPDFWRSHTEVKRLINESLEAESYADLSCFGLCFNRPWRSSEGDPVKPDLVTSNAAWMAPESSEAASFPNGYECTNLDCEDLKSMWMLVLNFWVFLFRKKWPWKCIYLMVVEGLSLPLLAQSMGWTLGEVSAGGDCRKLVVYCLSMLFLNLIYQRAEYVYEIDVPGASVRYEFTYRLHKQFLNFDGSLAGAWPEGRCSAMLSYDVIQAVNLTWESIFGLVKTSTSLVVCTIVMVRTSGGLPGVGYACVAMYVALFAGTIVITHFRIPNCLDLANRKRDWQLAWMAICTRQIRLRREGVRFNVDDAAQEVSDAALVFRKRAFHYYFIRLVAALTPTQMAFMAEMLVAMLAGFSAIKGKLTTAQAAALIAVVRLLSQQVQEWVTIMLNIVEGFSSLVEICEVFNHRIPESQDPTPGFFRAQSVPESKIESYLTSDKL